MSTAAVMLVKDEADIIEPVVRHLLAQVDQVIVADNGSSDGTREILERLPVELRDDPEVGYYQSFKMTALADDARTAGHEWIVPCDADEIWHSCETSLRLADLLAVQFPSVAVVTAELYDHVVTADDPILAADDPTWRIGWRRREPARLPKVAARLLPGLVIEQGNHGAHYPGRTGVASGIAVRHFPYRSVEQFVSKAVNGARAYAATDLPWSEGQHWREYGAHYERGGEQAIREIFDRWFYSGAPHEDPSLIYDPAPVLR